MRTYVAHQSLSSALPGRLPPGFEYPREFIEYLAFDEKERQANDGLSTSLTFSGPEDLADPYYERFKKLRLASCRRLTRWLPVWAQSTLRPLVHMASENDRHWFFVADGSNAVAFFDFGVQPWVTYRTGHAGFLSFIREVRADYGLPAWEPEGGR